MSQGSRRTRLRYVVVTDLPFPTVLRNTPCRTADEYFAGDDTLQEDLTIVNLCQSYHYLSQGYYVSLLAEARHQHVLPTLATIEAIHDPFVYFRALEEAGIETIDFKIVRGGRRLLPKVILPERDSNEMSSQRRSPLTREVDGAVVRYEHSVQQYVEITAVLGKTMDGRFRRACAAIFRVYPVPLLRIRMYQEPEDRIWQVGQIFPTDMNNLVSEELQLLSTALTKEKLRRASRARVVRRPHRIACLWDEKDPFAPSDEGTLERFERAAEKQDAFFEVIGKEDLGSLAEYDALFIRTVTGVNHFAFTFAHTAESLDIPVIDDTQSIIRCSNKVFLHELFEKNEVPTPHTTMVTRKTSLETLRASDFPMIVKLPDGTFSDSVKKVANSCELVALCEDMFKRSPLLIVQEFTPTTFDWRIGVLDGEVLFAARYHMVKDHWQIVGRWKTGRMRFGRVEAVPISEVPDPVTALAVEASGLIGNGLYGVDIKESDAGPLVIEVNDNPNIVEGDEDAVEKDRIYDRIIASLLRRIQESATEPKG